MSIFSSETGFLDVQGAPLFYSVSGQGQSLLLIHAGIADSRMWDDQVAAFTQQYRVVCFDLRGFGQSTVPSQPMSNLVDIAALLDHLGIVKTHILGISFGGKVAIDFALTYPARVISLMLGAPSIGGENPSPEVKQFIEQEDQLMEQGDVEAATELNLRMWVDGPRRTAEQVDPVVRLRLHDMQYHAFLVPTPEGATEIELDPPAFTRLHELQMPVLLLVGDYDLPVKISLIQQMAVQLPNAQHVLIANAGHILSMEQPAAFNQYVLAFLKQHVQ